MTTRAQDFRDEQQQSHESEHAKKARAKAKTRKEHVAKAKSDRATNATHNQADRASSGSAYQLERGTRKSTRAAANHAKADSSLRKTATARTSSADARAGRKKEGGKQKR